MKSALAPAYRKLYDYVVGTYLPKTRESIGMRELPDGAAWYAYRVRQFTTTSLSPDQIHALGLREVKRIRAQMDSVIASVGFKGSFADFARFLDIARGSLSETQNHLQDAVDRGYLDAAEFSRLNGISARAAAATARLQRYLRGPQR